MGPLFRQSQEKGQHSFTLGFTVKSKPKLCYKRNEKLSKKLIRTSSYLLLIIRFSTLACLKKLQEFNSNLLSLSVERSNGHNCLDGKEEQ